MCIRDSFRLVKEEMSHPRSDPKHPSDPLHPNTPSSVGPALSWLASTTKGCSDAAGCHGSAGSIPTWRLTWPLRDTCHSLRVTRRRPPADATCSDRSRSVSYTHLTLPTSDL